MPDLRVDTKPPVNDDTTKVDPIKGIIDRLADEKKNRKKLPPVRSLFMKAH